MFEYAIHRVYFDRKNIPHDDNTFMEIVCNTLQEALELQNSLQEADEYYHDYNKGYYIEHRIKLEYDK